MFDAFMCLKLEVNYFIGNSETGKYQNNFTMNKGCKVEVKNNI